MKKLLLLFFIPTLFTFSQNAKADMAGKYIGTLDVRLCNETEDGSTPDYTEGIELPKMSNVEV